MDLETVKRFKDDFTPDSKYMVVTKSQYGLTNTADSPIVFNDDKQELAQFKRGNRNHIDGGRTPVEIDYVKYEEIEHFILYKSEEEALEALAEMNCTPEEIEAVKKAIVINHGIFEGDEFENVKGK